MELILWKTMLENADRDLSILLGDTPENWNIVNNNILCKDGLVYDYSFGTGVLDSLFEF